jgi:hypothetical protein
MKKKRRKQIKRKLSLRQIERIIKIALAAQDKNLGGGKNG